MIMTGINIMNKKMNFDSDYYYGESDIELKPNYKRIIDQFSDEDKNEFWNKILNDFENKFGIDSRKKIQEFQDKYPLIFLAILGQLTQEYLAKNPQVMVEIYQQLLETIKEGDWWK